MPDPATTPAHEGGERETPRTTVEAFAVGIPVYGHEAQKLARDWLAMDAEITRLREALGFYADDENWRMRQFKYGLDRDVMFDRGKRARTALAGTSADAGARETVTVWSLENIARVAEWASIYGTWWLCKEPFKDATPFRVAITVTPGKERGT